MLYIVLIGAGWLASGMFVSLSIDSLFYISLTRVLGSHDLICHPRSIIRKYRFSIFFYVMCIIFLLCLVVNKWSWVHGVSFAVGMLLWMFGRKDLNTPDTLKQYVIHNRYYFENKDMYDLVNSDIFHAMWRKNSALHDVASHAL